MSNTNNDKGKTDDFGLPKVSYDPLETIGMEGNMFRGMTDTQRNRSLFVRVISVFVCFFMFLLPGSCSLMWTIYMIATFNTAHYASATDYAVGITAMIFAVCVSLLCIGAGYVGIRANIRKRK